MTTTRRTFMTGTLAVSAAAGLPLRHAFAAEELKLSTFVPPSHIIYAKVLVPWTEEVKKASGGNLTVKLFPSMQLGGKPPGLYRQMEQGIADIVFTLPGYTASDFPAVTLTELPGMSNSAADGTRKIWKHLDEYLARDFKAAKVLMLWNSDTAGFMSRSKPIRSVADVKGMKIRTPSRAQSDQLKALGAVPIDMPVTQIYNSLERGVVDAAMIPMSAGLDFKLTEVAKYFTIGAPLGRSPFLVAMNKARYDRLPPNLRKVIDDTTGLRLSLKGAEAYDGRTAETIAAVRANKDKELIELSADEHKKFMDAFRPLIKSTAEAGDKRGLKATALVKSYGLM
ncbi:MAG: TRAP transporter substrate-binding protein [Hyphomicrobiaceae bacterium]